MIADESAWEVVRAGRYPEAAEVCSRQLAGGEDLYVRRERAGALLLAGRAAEAMASDRRVIDDTAPDRRSAGDLLRLGVSHWHLNQTAEAIACWREALAAPYTD